MSSLDIGVEAQEMGQIGAYDNCHADWHSGSGGRMIWVTGMQSIFSNLHSQKTGL